MYEIYRQNPPTAAVDIYASASASWWESDYVYSAPPVVNANNVQHTAKRDSTNCKCPFCGTRHYLGDHQYTCKNCGGDVLAEGVL